MNFLVSVIGLIALSAALVQGDTDQAWREAALAKHNEYRRLHDAQPLTIAQDLCVMSQKWAEHLKSQEGNNKLVHSQTAQVGENLFYSMRGGRGAADAKVPPEVAVKSWYDEIKDYDFATGESTGGVTGHFTQVVWKGSKEVCVSYATKAEGNSVEFFVVANYRPPGNWVGNYVKNVARASGSAGLESRQKPANDSGNNQGSRKEAQQWQSLWWISLGCISTFSMYL